MTILTSQECYALETCPDCAHMVADHKLYCLWCDCPHGPREALEAAVVRIVDARILAVLTAGAIDDTTRVTRGGA